MNEHHSVNHIGWKYVLLCFADVLLSFFFHELSHFVTGEFLGYQMGMSLNKAFPVSGKFDSEADYQLISAAGPLFTLLLAFAIFGLMWNRQRKMLYPFLFGCFYMRFFALVISIRNPNDEARISKFLGWGTYTLPAITTAVLFYLVYKTSKRYGFSFRFNAANFGLILLFCSIVIMADQYLPLRIF
jgi:hypothetical protein